MSLSLEVREKSDKFSKILAAFKSAEKESVEIGFFNEQGVHRSSGLKYADLARIHERGVTKRLSNGGLMVIPPRPVLRFGLGVMRRKAKTSRALKRGFREWARSLDKNPEIDHFLESLGQLGVRSVKGIFGNKSFLIGNKRSTIAKKGFDKPMIETGELYKNVAYRTSRGRVIKTRTR